MSYRSIKRLLGETSLELKLLSLFGIALVVLIAGSFFLYGKLTEQLVYEQNPATGKLLVDTVLVQIHFENWPAIDKTGDIAFGSREDDKFLKLKKDIYAESQSQNYEARILLPDGTADDGKRADPYDVRMIEAFRGDSSLAYLDRDLDDRSQYEYFQPIYAKSSTCVTCHAIGGRSKLAEGDLMAVARVRISNHETRLKMNWNRAIMSALALVTMVTAIVAAYLIVRYVIVKPLKHLRDVSDAVSRGDMHQRAEIRTADEFEELGLAFNRMLRHLVDTQEELRRANSNLDNKVDELAQANMRLFEVNRLKSDFLATMSHELRTPLNSIIGFSDVLGSIRSLDDKQKRYVQNIQQSGKMLLDMINDILDLAKVESGKMDVRLSRFRIDQVLAAQCDMARPLAERKNIDLETELDPRVPELVQDQGKVQQVLNNLLSNAIKFTPEGGRIVATAKKGPGEDFYLLVADTGVGIAEADQQHIFEKFRQGRTVMPGGDAMTREYSGTGLGLSIVKELCRLLGGQISVQSQLGKGSVFVVQLPCVLDEPGRPDPSLAESLAELTRPNVTDFRRPGVVAPTP